MATLRDAIAYILMNYPENLAHELSNARVTKMLYLADWHQCISRGRQVTSINWFFDSYGPYVNEIKTTAESEPSLFSIENINNLYGQKKSMIKLKNRSYQTNISFDEKTSLDHVIETCKDMYWDDFIKLVYSTYPIMTSDRYSKLDLLQKAKDYKGTSQK